MKRYGYIALIGCVLCALFGFSVREILAANPSTRGQAYSTDEISLQNEWAEEGYRYEFYENKAYTCGIEGYHTFLVGYPSRSAPEQSRPLWLRMHGGVSGAWDKNGNWIDHYHETTPGTERRCARKPHMELEPGERPQACFLYGESPDFLKYWIDETGLVAKAKEGGFRFLIPSGCDHDFYSGTGSPDIYNPNSPDENGKLRALDGQLALRAAIYFTTQKFATNHIIGHGTSSGSMGLVNLVTALGHEGKRLSGAILDSSVISPYLVQLAEKRCLRHTGEEVAAYAERTGFYWEERNMGHRAIADGRIKTPVYDFWSKRDGVCDCPVSSQIARIDEAGNKISVIDPTGNTLTDTGCNLQHGLFDDAIQQYNPGGASRVHKVCVNDPFAAASSDPTESTSLDKKRGLKGQRSCDLHSPTQWDISRTGGDLDGTEPDYNTVIFQWIEERLEEEAPPLLFDRK